MKYPRGNTYPPPLWPIQIDIGPTLSDRYIYIETPLVSLSVRPSGPHVHQQSRLIFTLLFEDAALYFLGTVQVYICAYTMSWECCIVFDTDV